jgi:hypothetical protein
VSAVSRGIDRIEVTFDEPNLVANAGCCSWLRWWSASVWNAYQRYRPPLGPRGWRSSGAQGAHIGARHGGGRVAPAGRPRQVPGAPVPGGLAPYRRERAVLFHLHNLCTGRYER